MKRFEFIKKDIEKLHQSINNPMNQYLCISHHKKVLENIKVIK